jgi:hypothetical protein
MALQGLTGLYTSSAQVIVQCHSRLPSRIGEQLQFHVDNIVAGVFTRAGEALEANRCHWPYRRQQGHNPESQKLSGQVLINGVTGQVGTGTGFLADRHQ